MIIKDQFETLASLIGTKKISVDDLLNKAEDMNAEWNDFKVSNETTANFKISPHQTFIYKPVKGAKRETDISEFAFAQLCSKVGVPAAYIKKCFDKGYEDLALKNFKTWSANCCNNNMLIREYNGVTKAVLSDRFNVYDSARVLEAVKDNVDLSRYQANQAHLSQDRLHVRFVDFEPIYSDAGSKLYSGFTVSSSDVGRGSLNVKFFLYRFACQNGIVRIANGGLLFRQTHAGNITPAALDQFKKCFANVDILKNSAVEDIIRSEKKILSGYELDLYLQKAKHELALSDAGLERVKSLMDNTYDRSKWGLINAVTEDAKMYTLETRIDHETWAGNLLTAA